MLNIQTGDILKNLSKLTALTDSVKEISRFPLHSTINGSFSAVSGLDQLGNYHGVVLMGGPGSARSVLESYAEQVEWLRDALRASVQALTEQNDAFARSLDRADEGAVGEVGVVAFPPRPAPRYEPFAFPAPVVGPASSVAQLAAAFGATQLAQSHQAAGLWGKMASSIGAVAAGLVAVAADLRVHNYGEVVDSAIKQIVDVADTGKAFARNAALMVSSTMSLTPAQQQGSQLVLSMQNALNAMPDPQERQAAEAAFLQAFPAAYTPMLLPSVPIVRSLTDPSFSLSLGSLVPTGMGAVPGKGRKHDPSGLRPEGEAALRRIIHAARQVGERGGATFEEALARTPDVRDVSAESVGTVSAAAGNAQSAAASVPVVPGGGAPAASASGAPVSGAPATAASATSGMMGAPGAAMMSPGVMGRGQEPGMSRQTAGQRAGGDSSLPLLTMDEVSTRASSLSQYPVAAPVGAGYGGAASPVLPVGVASSVSGGLSPAGGVSGVLSPGTVPGGFSAATSPGAGLRAGGGGVAAAQGMRSHTFMGPMAGTAGAGGGGGQRNKKIKTITSAVEENENLRALLGDRPPVVPGVIGSWARG